METQTSAQLLEQTAKKKTEPVIGKRKYGFLKSLDLENITEENLDLLEKTSPGLIVSQALRQMSAYEDAGNFIPGNYKTVPKQEVIEREATTLTKEVLWDLFALSFQKLEGSKFLKNPDSIENIKPLFHYFCGDLENFKKCTNLSLVSKPSLDKGILIIGGYGNGKSTTMNALEMALKTSNIPFKGYSANEVVKMYETCGADPQQNVRDKDEFWKTMLAGTKYFDDVLTERIANNFGKVNLFDEIIQERYKNKKRTYISCNFSDEFPEDVNKGLLQFGKKYSSQVYDRLFEMFNVVVFKGKSQRT